jgi:hypothetical protein
MRRCLVAGVVATLLLARVGSPRDVSVVTYNDKDAPELLRPGREFDRLRWYFPPDQQRLRHVGDVTLVYSVSADGRAVDIRSVGQSTPEFVPAATMVLERLRFSIPRNWVAAGGPSLRRIFRVVYNLDCMPKAIAGADTVVITANCPR